MELRLTKHIDNDDAKKFLVSRGYILSYSISPKAPDSKKDIYPKTIKREYSLYDSPQKKKELSCINYLARHLSPEECRQIAKLLREEGIEC